jgi:outer membrane protein OmpA-like peptidoglycan-associated protein
MIIKFYNKNIRLYLRGIIVAAGCLCFFSILYADTKPSAYKLEYPVNTIYDDFSPSITADGKTLVFNSKSSEEGDHNIFITTFHDSKWSKPQPVNIINSAYNDETPYITPDGRLLLFSSDRPDYKANPEKQGYPSDKMTFNIYIAEKTEEGWTEPVKVPGEVNTDNNERSPSLSIDKKTIFFTRWPYKYIRKSRIMQASYSDGIFVAVTELPPPVNNDSYDISLTPALDGSGYFFSSIREGGLGGWDLYFIENSRGRWGQVKHLPRPINSEGNDLFLAETAMRVYFCSNRIRGYGGYDIYTAERSWNFTTGKYSRPASDDPSTIRDILYGPGDKQSDKAAVKDMPQNVEPIEKDLVNDARSRIILSVTNAEDGSPVSEKFTVYLKDTEDPSRPELRSVSMETDAEGLLTIFPKEDISWVIIKHESGRFSPARYAVKVDKGGAVETGITLYPAVHKSARIKKTGPQLNKPELKPVYFAFNSAKINLSYYPYLHTVIDFLRNNPDVKITIVGRADTRGLERSNRIISIKRARAVRKYMVNMEISRTRISVKGVGSAGSRWGGLDASNRRADIIFTGR